MLLPLSSTLIFNILLERIQLLEGMFIFNSSTICILTSHSSFAMRQSFSCLVEHPVCHNNSCTGGKTYQGALKNNIKQKRKNKAMFFLLVLSSWTFRKRYVLIKIQTMYQPTSNKALGYRYVNVHLGNLWLRPNNKFCE